MHPFKFTPRWLLNLFLVIVVFTIPGSADEKCSSCTQDSPPPPLPPQCSTCTQSSPPPPSPSPPPPSPPPPSPCPPPPSPPPTPKKPPTQECPPPPSPPASLVYVTGPPGTLYPIDENFNGGSQNSATLLPVLVSYGLLGLLAFW